MDRLNWDDIRLFLALAREGTLSGAAHQLGLGVATISRRIERIEAGMGVPLFLRHQQGHDLTDQGAALLPRAEAVELAVLDLNREAHAETEMRGRVRLASVESLIAPVVLPALTPLLAENPGLDVEISYAPDMVNLHRHDADMALRMAAPEGGNLVVRRLAMMGFGLYGPPDGTCPGRFVVWPQRASFEFVRTWSCAFGAEQGAQVTLNTMAAQLAAVHTGGGICVLPHFLARRAGLKLLRESLPDGGVMERPIYLVIHAELANSRRICAVSEALVDGIGAVREDLERC